MTKKVLEVKPYNDYWFDCVNNNLYGMIISKNKSYGTAQFYLEVNYYKKVIEQQFDTEETKKSLLFNGAFLPKVHYTFDLLKNAIDFKMFRFEGSESANQIIDFIKSNLCEDLFVFVELDRFFYPTGTQAGKTSLIHPGFIYGFDDDKKIFYLLEDCIYPGTLDYYELPYTSAKKSFEHFIENTKGITLSACRVKENLDHLFSDEDFLFNRIKLNATNLITGPTIYQQSCDLYYHTGLSCLDQFLEEFTFLLENLEDISMYMLRMTTFIQVHKKNIEFIAYLHQRKLISKTAFEELCMDYNELVHEWSSFKNQSAYVLESGKTNQDNIHSLKRKLQMIKHLEEKVAPSILEL